MKSTKVSGILSLAVMKSFVVSGNLFASGTQDPFFNQQWHLKNVGQKYQKDLDDTRNYTIHGLVGADVSLGNLGLPLKLKRQVIVAVLDSGIDVGHEELKPLLLLNEKECKDGKVPTGPTGDPDKNGLEGDCLGWNYTSQRFSRLVQDDVGHGTHVAGLIASVGSNGVGVNGYSNDIRLLPLKVYDDAEEGGKAAAATKTTNISDRVANALDYAVLRGAEVVNLSMGWPLVSHTEKVKGALDRAIAKGVIIVAGAGNDSHGSPIYPCAHPGVLCVGAMDGDGKISSFSNLAGHVDIFGPGDQILSTWPMGMTSDLYGIRGYEYRSGTSQAAPLVSGGLAVLKGLFPEENSQQTLARLLGSVRRDLPLRADGNTALSGLLNLDAAVRGQKSRQVRAFWKGSHLIDVDPGTAEVRMVVSIQNLTNVTLTQRVDFQMSEVVGLAPLTVTLKPLETQSVLVQGRVVNLSSSAQSRVVMKVKVGSEIFEHELRLVRPLSAAAGTAQELSPRLLPGMKELANEDLRSVTQLNGPQTARRFVYSSRTEGENLIVRLFEIGRVSVNAIGEVVIAGKQEIFAGFPVAALDMNGDGTLEFAIGTLQRNEKNEPTGLAISYVDQKVKPLFGAAPTIPMALESVIPSVRNAQMSEVKKGRWTPVVWTEGQIPKKDQNPDPFAFEPKAEGALAFTFVPEKNEKGEWTVVSRSLMNFRIQRFLRQQLQMRPTQRISLLGMMARGSEDARLGRVRILIRTGTRRDPIYHVLRGTAAEFLAGKVELVPFQLGDAFLEQQSFDETIVVDSSGSIGRGNQFFGLYTPTRGRVNYLNPMADGLGVGGSMIVETGNDREGLLGVIRTYQKGADAVSFGEGTTELQVMGSWNGQRVRSTLPIERSSFLPGQLFSQRFAAIVVDRDAKPALFWDNSPLFAPHIGAMVLENSGRLTEPLALSFRKPENCRVLNPQLEGNQFYLTLQCVDAATKNWKLLVRPFELAD